MLFGLIYDVLSVDDVPEAVVISIEYPSLSHDRFFPLRNRLLLFLDNLQLLLLFDQLMFHVKRRQIPPHLSWHLH